MVNGNTANQGADSMPTQIWIVTDCDGKMLVAFSTSAAALAESARLERLWQAQSLCFHVSAVTMVAA